MKIIKAPEYDLSIHSQPNVSIFLAGSIEMGKADDWQKTVTQRLADSGLVDYVFNPRRDDWDTSWVQSINNPQFNEQVTWELDHIDHAMHVFFYFDPKTMSPISLLELGVCTCSNAIVVCPEGYWRKGNVDIVCDRFDIPCFTDLDEGIECLLYRLTC